MNKPKTNKIAGSIISQVKWVLSLLLICAIYGCGEKVNNAKEIISLDDGVNNKGELFQVEYDECQYIVYRSSDKAGLTHKGNCNNQIHQK